MSNHVSKPTVTRTIRIEKENDLILETEAKRNGVSVNALVSNLIDRYVDSIRFYPSSSIMSMGSETIMAFIDYLSDEEIAEIANMKGKKRIQDSLFQRGMDINLKNVLWFFSQILGQYYAWFRCDHNKTESSEKLHFTHSYGYKWSVFIDNYVSGIIQEILNIKINSVVSERAVNIEIIRR